MTPVAKTGLHCGLAGWRAGRRCRGRVTPVAKTGLHCGVISEVAAGQTVDLVTPVAKTGLHCGDAQLPGSYSVQIR